MDIRVSGHQVETGEALQSHVEKRLGAIANKYFSKALSSHATFGRGPHERFTSDIVMHVMQGLVLKGRGEAQDAHVALDQAADRIEKQLRRYMRRLQDRLGIPAAATLYLGDDVTDEDAFQKLPEPGLTVHVGAAETPSAARFQARDPADAVQLLAAILKILREP